MRKRLSGRVSAVHVYEVPLCGLLVRRQRRACPGQTAAAHAVHDHVLHKIIHQRTCDTPVKLPIITLPYLLLAGEGGTACAAGCKRRRKRRMPVSVRANRSALSPSIALPFNAATWPMPVCSCRRTSTAYAPPAHQTDPVSPRLTCNAGTAPELRSGCSIRRSQPPEPPPGERMHACVTGSKPGPRREWTVAHDRKRFACPALFAGRQSVEGACCAR